jgi:hypothetical protein
VPPPNESEEIVQDAGISGGELDLKLDLEKASQSKLDQNFSG